MKTEQSSNQHWTDNQLIAHLYGVGPESAHLFTCAECQSRFEAIEKRKSTVLDRNEQAEEVATEFLAAQRRAIYARLDEKRGWFQARQWAPALAMLAIVAGSFVVYQSGSVHSNQISDAELVQQVSQIAEDSTPQSVAPIAGLFGE